MLIVRGNEAPPQNARAGVIAIGNFDGVHRGHQALIKETRSIADQLDTRAGVIVFEPHPREFFAPDQPHFRLTPLREKLRLFDIYGFDTAIVLDFCEDLAGLSAQQFIEDVLILRLGVRHVVVGYDFLFGKGRTGTVETLAKAGVEHGFGFTVVRAQGLEPICAKTVESGSEKPGGVFSSSAIRKDLATGDVAAAGRSMGHWWRVTGTVIEGAKIGSQIGFPTANIELPASTALAFGVYAVRVVVAQRNYDGAAYFGTRPTVDDGPARLEVTIFEFSGDLYGQEISVEFIAYVRPDTTFESMDELKSQIEKDCVRVRELLSNAGELPQAVPQG